MWTWVTKCWPVATAAPAGAIPHHHHFRRHHRTGHRALKAKALIASGLVLGPMAVSVACKVVPLWLEDRWPPPPVAQERPYGFAPYPDSPPSGKASPASPQEIPEP